MTDQEINRKLAMAIGWLEKDIRFDGYDLYLLDRRNGSPYGSLWRIFDHRKWYVVGPIAQRYDCFPRLEGRHWYAKIIRTNGPYADTPQKAIALAVISAHEAGVLE